VRGRDGQQPGPGRAPEAPAGRADGGVGQRAAAPAGACHAAPFFAQPTSRPAGRGAPRARAVRASRRAARTAHATARAAGARSRASGVSSHEAHADTRPRCMLRPRRCGCPSRAASAVGCGSAWTARRSG
jgi:hypothetical protein